MEYVDFLERKKHSTIKCGIDFKRDNKNLCNQALAVAKEKVQGGEA